MSANDYFSVLELDAKKVLSLPDDRAEDMVLQAYDRKMNAGHALGEENPRADLYAKAKKILCDPEARRHHAEELGYTAPDESPPPARPKPRHRKSPEPRHRISPEPRRRISPEPRRRISPEPRRRKSGSGEAGPWWMGGLLAMPAAILYMSASGLTFARTPQETPLDWAALVLAILTARFIGAGWLKILFIGPFLLGVGWRLAGLTIGAFARDVGSWSVAPEIGVLAVLTALGLGLGLAGQVRPTADITKEYLGSTTVCFFIIALVLIPTVSLLIPTRSIPTRTDQLAGENEEGTVDRGPTAQTEEELNLTRNDWRRIQAGLRVLGHYTGAVDGLAGPMTRTSITAWQRTQRGVATSFLNQAHADTLAALAPAPAPPLPRPGATRGRPGTGPDPATARLVIRAEPDSRIALDGEEAGFTSESGILTIDDVTPGGHVLSAEKDGFDTVTSTIEVTERVSQVVELVTRALPGRLTVTTNADNAIVAIDGGEPRAAPDDIEVESGARLVTVSAPGYNTDEQYVDIAADATTTHHATLEETSLDAEIAQLRRLFDSGSYGEAAEVAALLARMLVAWGNLGIDVRENLALTRAIQGRALYALGNFEQSVQSLYNAVRFGQQIELPIKHRHGGGGFRQGFCTGFLVYSLDQIAFRSIDDPDHGFAVEPEDIRRIEPVEAQEGYLSRLNTEVEGRGSMDFVHPNSEQQRREPDSPLVTDIVCRDCNHALAVQEQMLRFLTRNTQ